MKASKFHIQVIHKYKKKKKKIQYTLLKEKSPAHTHLLTPSNSVIALPSGLDFNGTTRVAFLPVHCFFFFILFFFFFLCSLTENFRWQSYQSAPVPRVYIGERAPHEVVEPQRRAGSGGGRVGAAASAGSERASWKLIPLDQKMACTRLHSRPLGLSTQLLLLLILQLLFLFSFSFSCQCWISVTALERHTSFFMSVRGTYIDFFQYLRWHSWFL